MLQETQSKDELRDWWEKTWKERDELLRSEFGRTEPREAVIAFSWKRVDLVIPGGCCLVFPPRSQEREHWLYLSHGLTQPLEPDSRESEVSAYGWEFAILSASPSTWAPYVLYELLSYWMETKNRIDVGHRMPMVYYSGQEGEVKPILRDLQSGDSYPPLGQMRAVLVWPYLLYPGRFSTSTGYFGILVATAITQEEWDLAKSTSSTHLLLLLLTEGIGQISDLERQTVTARKTFRRNWQGIRDLSQEQAEALLRERAPL